MKPIKVTAKGRYLDEQEYDLLVHRYGDRTPAIVLNTGSMREATLTTCIPGTKLEQGEILVKEYGENEGIAASLAEQGIITDTGKTVPAGYAVANIYKLNEELFV